MGTSGVGAPSHRLTRAACGRAAAASAGTASHLGTVLAVKLAAAQRGRKHHASGVSRGCKRRAEQLAAEWRARDTCLVVKGGGQFWEVGHEWFIFFSDSVR